LPTSQESTEWAAQWQFVEQSIPARQPSCSPPQPIER